MDNLTLALICLTFLLLATALLLQHRWLRRLQAHQAQHCGLLQAAYELIDPEGMQQARQALAAKPSGQAPYPDDTTIGQVYEATEHGPHYTHGYKFSRPLPPDTPQPASADEWMCPRCGDHFTPEDAQDGDIPPLCAMCGKAQQPTPTPGSRLIHPDDPIHDQGHQDDPQCVSWVEVGEDNP